MVRIFFFLVAVSAHEFDPNRYFLCVWCVDVVCADDIRWLIGKTEVVGTSDRSNNSNSNNSQNTVFDLLCGMFVRASEQDSEAGFVGYLSLLLPATKLLTKLLTNRMCMYFC